MAVVGSVTVTGMSGVARRHRLGPVRAAVVGSVTATGMSRVARRHRLEALLSSSSSFWPGISPH